jgi:hypothetical protein
MIAALSMALAMSFTVCASVQKPSGFLGDYYKNLKPGPEVGVKQRWIKPGVDFSNYNRVMLDAVFFYFAADSDDKGIDPEVMKELSDEFNQEMVNALKDRYSVVSDPGSDVIRIKIALTGINQSRPVLSGVSTVVPVETGRQHREERNHRILVRLRCYESGNDGNRSHEQ